MLKNQIKTVILLGAMTGLLLGIGRFIGGTGGLVIALVFSIGMNLSMWWWSDKIVLWMYGAKPADAKTHSHLFAIVKEVSGKAELPMPKVYIIPSESPNAFATGATPSRAAVAVTEGIMNLLTEKELRGVLGHELAHVKNRDTLVTTVAACIAGVISYIASMARWTAIFGGMGSRDDGPNIGELIAITVITPLIAMMIQLAISRSREYLADERGSRIVGDPLALASALKKLEAGSRHIPLNGSPATSSLFIVNPLSGNAVFKLLSTHPPIQERVKRLEGMKV